MSKSKLSLAVVVSAIILSSITAFASFKSDYQGFITEVVKNVPTKQLFDPNMMSGSLAVSYDATQGEKMSVDAMIAFASQIDKTSQNIALNLSASGSYTTESGSQFIDMAGQSIIVPDQGGISKLYVTLDHLKSNLPQIQETEVQSMITKLTANWYVGTGEADSIGVDQVLGQFSTIGLITQDLDAQVKLYQHFIKYPIITPIGQQATNSIYQVKLNKRNTAHIMTMLTTMSESDMTASDRNNMKREMYRSMVSVRSNGTFDPTTNHIKLNLSDKGFKTALDITPQSVNMTAKDNTNLAIAKIAWDRDMISINANGTMDDATFAATMKATQKHVELSGSYQDDTNKGSMSITIHTDSTNVTVSEPNDALPMSDLGL